MSFNGLSICVRFNLFVSVMWQETVEVDRGVVRTPGVASPSPVLRGCRAGEAIWILPGPRWKGPLHVHRAVALERKWKGHTFTKCTPRGPRICACVWICDWKCEYACVCMCVCGGGGVHLLCAEFRWFFVNVQSLFACLSWKNSIEAKLWDIE